MSTKSLEEKIISLRKTIAWMDLVLANISQGIIVLDESWRIVFVNQWVSELTNRSRIMLLGKSLDYIVPVETAKPVNKTTMTVHSVADLNGVYEVKKSRSHTEISIQARFIPQICQAVCIITPVSTDLKTEEAMRQFYKEVATMRQEIVRLQNSASLED